MELCRVSNFACRVGVPPAGVVGRFEVKLIFAWKFPSKHPGMTSNWGAYSLVMMLGIIKIVVA